MHNFMLHMRFVTRYNKDVIDLIDWHEIAFEKSCEGHALTVVENDAIDQS